MTGAQYAIPEPGFRTLAFTGAAALILLPHLYYLAGRVLSS